MAFVNALTSSYRFQTDPRALYSASEAFLMQVRGIRSDMSVSIIAQVAYNWFMHGSEVFFNKYELVLACCIRISGWAEYQ